MVTTESNTDQISCRFIIRPNRSLTNQHALLFFASLCLLLLGISIGFLLQGLWAVLPFAGLELLALGAGLYLCLRSSAAVQVVTIDEDSVRVDQVHGKVNHQQAFLRGWVRVQLEAPSHYGHPSRLTLGSHGRLVEIGAFLVEHERIQLAKRLQQAIRYPIDR